MNYYLDTEFHEYKKKSFFGKDIDTIELISIGIVAEDGREYYAISKDFDVEAAWNNKWLRENVLESIFWEIVEKHKYKKKFKSLINFDKHLSFGFESLKLLITTYGRSNKEIAKEIKKFVYTLPVLKEQKSGFITGKTWNKEISINFYAYYADYDWVVFCWLFGRMIDLPEGFPMYCRDLKQILDEVALKYDDRFMSGEEDLETKLSYIKNKDGFPKQLDNHHALEDAKWDRDLHNKIIELSNF